MLRAPKSFATHLNNLDAIALPAAQLTFFPAKFIITSATLPKNPLFLCDL